MDLTIVILFAVYAICYWVIYWRDWWDAFSLKKRKMAIFIKERDYLNKEITELQEELDLATESWVEPHVIEEIKKRARKQTKQIKVFNFLLIILWKNY